MPFIRFLARFNRYIYRLRMQLKEIVRKALRKQGFPAFTHTRNSGPRPRRAGWPRSSPGAGSSESGTAGCSTGHGWSRCTAGIVRVQQQAADQSQLLLGDIARQGIPRILLEHTAEGDWDYKALEQSTLQDIEARLCARCASDIEQLAKAKEADSGKKELIDESPIPAEKVIL